MHSSSRVGGVCQASIYFYGFLNDLANEDSRSNFFFPCLHKVVNFLFIK